MGVMDSCGMTMMKYILFVFNFIFVVSGIGIIAAGAAVLYQVREYDHFMTNSLVATPIVLIIAGVVIFVVAFLGCCGAIKESYNMLMAFAVLLLVIFIVELAVGIAAAVNKNEVNSVLKTALRNSLAEVLRCGEIYDWENVSVPLPASCCPDPPAQPLKQICNTPATVYTSGCYDTLKIKVKDGAIVIMGVGIGLAFIQFVGIVFAFCLASAIKRGEEK